MSTKYIQPSFPVKDSTIKYRYYEPNDNDKALQLETDIHLSSVLGGLIQYKKKHINKFDSKSKRFPESFILIAEDNSNSDKPILVGTACVGIKMVTFSGSKMKAGIISKLNMIADYHGFDVGQDILQMVEQIALEMNIKLLYLYVSDSDTSAQNLYFKLNFQESAKKTFTIGRLLDKKNVEQIRKNNGKVIKFGTIEKEDCLKDIKITYEKEDLFPEELNKLFDLPEYIQSYTVQSEDGTSRAGLSVFNENKDSIHEYTEFILPICFFNNDSLKLSLYFLGAILAYILFKVLFNIVEAGLVISGSVSGGLYIAAIVDYLKIYRLLKILRGDKKVRYFAPYYIGDEKSKELFFKMLLDNVDKIYIEQKIHSGIFGGNKPEFLSLFSNQIPISYSIFSKVLTGNAVSQLSNESFHDFRDF